LIQAISVSLERVTKLLTILPRRGPSAFTTFRNLLSKDYHWLAEDLDAALRIKRKDATKEEIHLKLINVINNQVVPLVFPETFNFVSSKDHIHHTITKLGDLTRILEKRVLKALELMKTSTKTICIETLINEKLKADRSADALSTEIKELKRRAKQDEKLKKENETLKSNIEILKKKLKENSQVIKDGKKHYSHLKREKDEATKKVEQLKREIQCIKKEIESTNSMCEITPLYGN
jgi:DNA repair exonuclease SbcCD ATPase subunit